jgi:hypothetical protein
MAIPSRQKSPPLVPLGLHGLFVGFRTINPAVVFFCHTFCKSKKDVCTEIYPDLKRDRHHRAALAPEKKTTQSYYT